MPAWVSLVTLADIKLHLSLSHRAGMIACTICDAILHHTLAALPRSTSRIVWVLKTHYLLIELRKEPVQ